ncbi:MAG TPA: glycosyltransferase family 2 protein [Symbiobacteriaceae bacterium]|nr:glycosyltransferase family 2 protein [Symbiobacteriaceae bacterium]
MASFLFWSALIITVASLGTLLEGLWANHLVSRLDQTTSPSASLGPNPPHLSLIVPACNEAPKLEAAVRSMLRQDYPNLELILIDDRSTDETGAIIDRLAQEFPQIRPVHITELPPGWLGKNHALWVGAQVAQGDYLLFTDADVQYNPTTCRRAVALCEERGLDHLTLAPAMLSKRYLLTAWVGFFIMSFLTSMRPYRANMPKSKAGVGIGAFNLVRRQAYEGIGTMQPISLRPDDDLQLGRRLKRMGYRQLVMDGKGMIAVEWYSTLWEAIRGLEKNTFAGFDYNLPITVGAISGILVVMVWPFIGLFLASGTAQALFGATILLQWAIYLIANRTMDVQSWRYLPAYPISALLFCFTCARALFLTLWKGGISWRGTFYPLSLLRSQRGN